MAQGTSTRDHLLKRAQWMSTPRHQPLVMAFGRWFAPLHLRYLLGVTELRISPGDLARLDALRGQRVVLTPNHPAFDPVVMFQLSTKLRMSFYYLAAREVFNYPLDAFVVSHVGAFAVERGAHDGDAQHTTRRLIREGKHWLVLFPEGQAYYLHDAVLSFLPGAARLGLGALDDLAASGQALPPVYIVPVALRYHCLGDMRPKLLNSLRKLERRLGMRESDPPMDWHMRLGRVADHVLECNEDSLGLVPADDSNLQARLDVLREMLLARSARALGLDIPPADSPLRNRLRKIIVAAKRIGHTPPSRGGSYAWRLFRRMQAHTTHLQREVERVVEFVAMTGSYSLDVPTVENYLDVLGRLELEVCGWPRHFGPRAVTIRVGEPLDLREYYEQYREHPDQASQAAIGVVEQRVRAMLAETAHLMNPLPPLPGQ